MAAVLERERVRPATRAPLLEFAADADGMVAWNVALGLGGTVALALVFPLLPVRRAVRFRPGHALRYP